MTEEKIEVEKTSTRKPSPKSRAEVVYPHELSLKAQCGEASFGRQHLSRRDWPGVRSE